MLKSCLTTNFQNQLWHHSSMATIKGEAFNQGNTEPFTELHEGLHLHCSSL